MTINIDYLLERGQATERDVVEYLVTHYYDAIVHLAISVLADVDEAHDVAQQTMIQATNKIGRYQPHTNLKAWVYKIGLNLARGHLRKRKARERLTAVLTLQWWGERSVSAEITAISNETVSELHTAIAQLKAKHRIPLLLRYDHDLSTKEIADVMGIPHGTVRSRLHHAHQQLHRLLTEVTR